MMANGSKGDGREASLTTGDANKVKFQPEIDEPRPIPPSQQLTEKELEAFHQAFILFDHGGNGRISCEEFLETLRRVGVTVSEDFVCELILAQDKNGNGELDFEEYLNFMTKEDIFLGLLGGLRAPNTPDYRDVLLYELMSRFMLKNCTEKNQREGIVEYYTRKLQTAAKKHKLTHAAHVVHHYADGARALGLSDKEVLNQLESIREKSKDDEDEKKKNSPYAQPIHLLMTPKSAPKLNQHYPKQPGWSPSRIASYGVNLPKYNVKEPKTFDCNYEIRRKVHTVKEDYYWHLSKAQHKNLKTVWKNIYIDGIPNNKLQAMMKDIYDAYAASRLTGCRGQNGKPAKVLPPIIAPHSSTNDV